MVEMPLIVNGFPVTASYSEAAVTDIFIPLLLWLTQLQQALGRRAVAFLAAPPAAGKSTLAAFLEALSKQLPGVEPLQAVGIDGFHYRQEYILTHTVERGGVKVPMKDVKGCPESYNTTALRERLRALRERDEVPWPLYDRRLHDPVEDAVVVMARIVLVEGNWLLLNEGEWAEMHELCDYSIFLHAEEAQLRDRLIERKMRGGLTRAEAEKFYETGDGPNLRLCLEKSQSANLMLKVGEDGALNTLIL